MADQTNSWHGAVNTSWTEDGNWTLGTAPQTDASNDTLIFLPNARNPPRVGLDRSGDATGDGLQPAMIYIQPGVRYDIGQPGAELMLRAKKVVHRGRGTLYYASAADNIANPTADILIASPNLNNAAVISATTNSWITRIGVVSGRVNINVGPATIEQLHITGRGGPGAEVFLTVAAGKIALIVMDDGQLTTELEIDQLVVAGGLCDMRGALATSTLFSTVDGGILRFNIPNGSSPQHYAIRGMSDFIADGREARVPFLYHFPGARVNRDAANVVVNVTLELGFGLDKE